MVYFKTKNPKLDICILEGRATEDVSIFGKFSVRLVYFCHLVNFPSMWYILCHWVNFPSMGYILWPFGIFSGRLEYFSTVLVRCTKKNLAS
jgi:hypothetical protein